MVEGALALWFLEFFCVESLDIRGSVKPKKGVL